MPISSQSTDAHNIIISYGYVLYYAHLCAHIIAPAKIEFTK